MKKTICTAKKLREIASNYHSELNRALWATERQTPITLQIDTGKGTYWIDFDPEHVFVIAGQKGHEEDAYLHGKLLPSEVSIDIYAGCITDVDLHKGTIWCDVENDVLDGEYGPILGTVMTCSWCGAHVEYPDTGPGAVQQCLNKIEDGCEIMAVMKKPSYEYHARRVEKK